MIRLAHISDTHLGYRSLPDWKRSDGRNQRNCDFLSAWDRAIATIVAGHAAEPFDLVIHSGDIFDSPVPDPAALAHFGVGIQKLIRAKLPVVIIAGNHDMSRMRRSVTPLAMLAQFFGPDDGVYWAYDRTRVVHFVDLADYQITVDCWPHGAIESLTEESYLESQRELNQSTHARIFVGHGSMDSDRTFVQDDFAVDLEQSYDYIALGHIHVGTDLSTAFPGFTGVQAGSTERSGWRDLPASPRWVEYDGFRETGQLVEHPIGSREMVDVGTVSVPDEYDVHGAVNLVADYIIESTGQKPKRDAMLRVSVEWSNRSASKELARRVRGTIGDDLGHVAIDFVEPGEEWRAPDLTYESVDRMPSIPEIGRAHV